MSLIRPFAALRPAAGRAAEVVAPPYDVVSSAEARAMVAGRPHSFLHVSRPEIDLPAGTDPYADAVYEQGAEALRRLVAEGMLRRDPRPCYYAYRMSVSGHVQVGLALTAQVAAYEAGRIKRHEFTRPDKENDRVRHIEALGAQTGPVLLAHRAGGEADLILAEVTRRDPTYDVHTAHDGVRHTLWAIPDEALIHALTDAFEAQPALYIADGHHRSAAAARVADSRGGPEDASHRYFMAVSFPHTALRILDYNRLVADLGGLSPEALLARAGEHFEVSASAAPVRPQHPGEFGLYLPGQWYRLEVNPARVPADPVGRLDVSVLHALLIEPLLGVSDPRRDARIDFVGGSRGVEALAARVDAGTAAVAFSLYPTALEDLMAVADAGEVMPPKSTWFEPKLADGLLSHVLD